MEGVTGDDLPLVTVIMPVRHEADFIARSLGAVLAQDYPVERLEILVADGRSADGTREIVQALQGRHSHLRLIDNPGRIVPTGLNAALRHARGEIIVRVDGHTEIAPDYIRRCVAALQCSGADNVGGPMIASGETPFAEAVALATSTFFGVGNARFHYSNRDEWVDTVYMGAWPRTIFARFGMFDEEAECDEDDEFNYRLLERGGRVWLSQSIHSRYMPRSTPATLWQQYFRYGCWKVWVFLKHPRQMRLSHLAPGAFIFTLVSAAILAPFSGWARTLLVLAAGIYSLANVVASLTKARKHGWRQLRWLPIVFAILHVSYGLGFIVGLAKFANLWTRLSLRHRRVSRITDDSRSA
jgi:glycosyltransferase involved in cell wall biosynthesis